MLEYYPTQFECVDKDTSDPIFKVTTFDAACAELEISTVVSPEDWPKISKAIQDCLDQMFKETV